MLGKRKEQLIRDIAAMVFTAVDSATARIAHSRRGALEREEVERIAAIVVEAIKADRIEWTTPVEPKPEPLYPESYKLFGTPETGHGRLIIEPDGGDDRFTLTAYLPEGMLLSPLHVFKRGTRDECIASWAKALEWMEKRFPKNKA